jgi:CDP-diglyceride synthetase
MRTIVKIAPMAVTTTCWEWYRPRRAKDAPPVRAVLLCCCVVVLLCCCVVVVNYSNTSNIVDTDRLLCTLFWLYFLFQVATTMAWANKPCPAASSAPEAPSTTPRFVLHCRTAKIAPMASTGTMWVW